MMIARKSFLIVASYFITRFAGWVGLVILARMWGDYAPDALGIIGYSMSFLALFNIIGDLGFSRAHVKRISEGKDIGTCIGTFAVIKLVLSGVMLTILFGALFIWKTIFNQGFDDATTESVIIVFALYYLFLNLTHIATFTFEGRQEIAKRQIVQMFEAVKTPLMIMVAFAGVGVAGRAARVGWPEFLEPLQIFITKHALGSLAMTYAFAMIATFLVGMWLLRNYPIKKPNKEYLKSYFVFAMPIMLFSVIGIISINIDKIMIGFYWTETEVGYYFSIQQILQIIMVLYLAVGTILFPTISKFHSKKNLEKIKKTTLLAERYISMIMIPPMVLIIVLAYPIINIFLSSVFLPAASVLIVLSIYTFIFSLNRPYSSLITGMNRPGTTTKIGLMICLVNIPLNFLFIPHTGLLSPLGINGPTGAAIATLCSVLVGFIGFRYAAKRLSGIKILQTHTPRHMIAGVVMGIVLYFIAFKTNLFPNVYWYFLLMFAAIGLAVYLGVLFLLREFNKKDFNFFLDILHPKKMAKYITSELKEKPKQKK
jgi:O-antigen/teichoic acid export membrane protein